jgi:epsin
MFETKQPMVPSSQQHQQQQQQPLKQEEKKVEASTPTGMWAQASNFVSLDSLGKKSSNTTQSTGPSMNALKNTSVQADWNNWASNNQTRPAAPPAAKPSSAFDDLLF